MLPLEPTRFSTTTGSPICSVSFWPSTRAAMSGAPPGGIGTIRWMGRDGYCAAARVENNVRRRGKNRAGMGLVGAIGLEPATPTMSISQCGYAVVRRQLLTLLGSVTE